VTAGVAQTPLRAADDPVLSTKIVDAEILEVPNIRYMLKEQNSPFVNTNNKGGGCAPVFPHEPAL
jgi:hypothetical protein